jgi:serine/threonine protein kinase
LSGKYSGDYFTRKGELRNITKLKVWGLQEVLMEKYNYSTEEACELVSFLRPMLDLIPEKRASAGSMMNHSWLQYKGHPLED